MQLAALQFEVITNRVVAGTSAVDALDGDLEVVEFEFVHQSPKGGLA